MEITDRLSGVAPGAPISEPASIEKLVDDFVAFAESKPSAAAVKEKLMSILHTPLWDEVLGFMQSTGPLMVGATKPEQQIAIFDAAVKALGDMRTAIAGGRDFEVARALMGTKNGRTGALLASAVDNPVKLKLGWALFALSAIAARSAISTGKV